MDIFIVIGAIFIISFILAIRSLRNLTKIEEMEHAHKELKKGRVIFQNDSSSSASS